MAKERFRWPCEEKSGEKRNEKKKKKKKRRNNGDGEMKDGAEAFVGASMRRRMRRKMRRETRMKTKRKRKTRIWEDTRR